jgi:signal transduction histidine kinase
MKPFQVGTWAVVKRALIIFLPLALILAVITMIIYQMEVKTEKTLIENKEIGHIEQLKYTIFNDFDTITSDLMVTSTQLELERILENDKEAQRNLEEEFLSMSKIKRLYDQIRFLDESGMEIVRINYNNGNPTIVPEEKLQNKGKRYYFEDAFRLNENEVFVSPLDLNIERGEIEVPLKPMIRLGTPIFDNTGNKRGIMLLNYFGSKMLDGINRVAADSSGDLMFLNKDGFFLKGARPEDEWGFMYEERRNRTFGNKFPEEWQQILDSDSGQFQNGDGFFLFETIYPLKEFHKTSTGSGRAFEPSEAYLESSEYFWKIVIHVPPNVLAAVPQRILYRLLILDGLLLVILGGGSLFYAQMNIRREMAQKELQEANIKLEETDRLKSVFLASMSHELRTPLNSIIGFTGVLLMGMAGELNEVQKKQLNQVKSSANHLLGLINDILDLSKIEAGKVEVSIEEFGLDDIVNEVAETFSPAVSEKGLKLLSEVPEGITLLSDKRRVKQVLMNLVSNAVKFTDKGEIKIEGKILEDGKKLEISVTDTGIGIKKEEMNKLFKPFQQIDMSSSKRHEGTGLGLNLSKKLASLLLGDISVESEYGKGSVFTFTFPLEYKEEK